MVYFKNNNNFRVKVVVGIDGVSVLTGKPVSPDKDERGYVLDPDQVFDLDGYRIDNDTVAAFKFSKAETSYAVKDKKLTGTTGVIGIRVFKERDPDPIIIEKHHHHYPTGGVLRSTNFCASEAGGQIGPQSYSEPVETEMDSNPFNLGSTWGHKIESKVVEVTFKADQFVTEMLIYYADRTGLLKLGVDVSRTTKVALPIAFGGQYCTAPQGWTG